MKRFFLNFTLFVMLIAILVGMFYIYTQDQTISKHKKDELKLQTATNAKIIAARRRMENLRKDFDGDGLTLAEEQKMGTSDYTKDSDGDGVPDNLDEIPMGTGRMVVKYMNWDYKGSHELELAIPQEILAYYEKTKRPVWKGRYDYFAEFIDANDRGIRQLASKLEGLMMHGIKEEDWSYYDQVMFVVKMVQSIRYTDDKLTGFDDYTKYPMQTINDGTGDCEDMAILAAAILNKLEFEVMLVHLDRADSKVAHLGLAVLGEGYEGGHFWNGKDGKEFYYIETTNPEWDFGQLPEEWSGTVVKASLIEINQS